MLKADRGNYRRSPLQKLWRPVRKKIEKILFTYPQAANSRKHLHFNLWLARAEVIH